MKKIIFLKLSIALSVVSILTGCGSGSNVLKHLHSSFSGLNRKITLYSANGTVLKEWVTQAKVEDNGGTCFFLDDRYKAIKISGTFIIQEQ